jgi:hypothetical protein
MVDTESSRVWLTGFGIASIYLASAKLPTSLGGELAAANAEGWRRVYVFLVAGHGKGPQRMKRTAAVRKDARGMKQLEPRVFVVDDDQSVRTTDIPASIT